MEEEIYASVMTRELIDFITTEIRKLDNVGILYCGKHCCYTPDMQCYEILASPKFLL